jgi:hypothetical protein
LASKAIQAFASRVNINAKDNGIIAEVFSPHLKTSAIAYTNLEKSYRSTTKRRKVAVLQGDIMMPFMNDNAPILCKQAKQLAIVPILLLYIPLYIRGFMRIKLEAAYRFVSATSSIPVS